MIKITTVDCGYKNYFFKKYIAENGGFVCTINGEIVSPDEGNKKFLKIKVEYPKYKIEKEVLDYNDEEIINYIKSGIDRYVEYIDDYKRYRQIKDRNEKLWNIISHFEAIR